MEKEEHSNIQRNRAVDAIRGLAIFLVVFGHSLNNIMDSSLVSDVPWTITYAQRWIYSFHMQLFFFLSGFFVYRSVTRRNVVETVRDKALHLVVPYVFWSSLVVIAKAILPGFQNHPEDIENLKHMFSVPHGIQWFLYALFIFDMIYLLFAKIFRNETVTSVIFLLFGIMIYYRYTNGGFPYGSITGLVAVYMVFFAAGTFGRWMLGWLEKAGRYIWVPVIAYPVVYRWAWNHNGFMHGGWKYPTVIVIYGVAVSVIIGARLLKYWEPAIKIGQKTMDIYCLHQFVAGAVRVVLLYAIGTSFLWGRVLLVTSIAMIGSYLLAISPIAKWKAYQIVMGYYKPGMSKMLVTNSKEGKE